MNENKFSPEQNAAWASLAKDPSQRQALAEVIVEVVKPNHVTNTYMNYLMTSKAMNTGDLLIKRVRKGIRVHTLTPGSVHPASEITVSDRTNFVLDGAIVKVTYNEDELNRGDIGTLADIRQEMSLKLRDYYFNKTFTALSTIWNGSNTPSNYTDLGTAITATALQNAINQINIYGGGVKAVIGSRRALTPITTFGAFFGTGTPSTSTTNPTTGNQVALEEIRQTGWLGKYYGADIIAIDQIYDSPDTYAPLLPEDKILVLGQKVGEFITYGPVRTQTWTDFNIVPPQEFLQIYAQYGMIIDNAQGIYVIKVTN